MFESTVLRFQVSDRAVQLTVPGEPLTKAEIGILREYLEIQERIAPECAIGGLYRSDPARANPHFGDTRVVGASWAEPGAAESGHAPSG